MSIRSSKTAPSVHSVLGWIDRHCSAIVLGPLLITVACLAILPFLIALWNSFTDFSFNLPGRDGSYIGFANYLRVFTGDSRLLDSVKHTGLFVVCTLPIEFLLGLCVALLLWRSMRAQRYLLPLMALPMLLAPVTVGLVWRLLLHVDYGPLGFYWQHLPGARGSSILGIRARPFSRLSLSIFGSGHHSS